MKVAIIGMGNMGSNYAAMICEGKIPGMILSAVTRISPQRYEKLKNLLPQDLQIFDSADELFSAFDSKKIFIDGILVVTPNYSHEEISVKAFERGISVLCDKPAGVYSRQARIMNDAYTTAKQKFPALQFGVIFQQRTYPVYKKMKEIVQSGQYGKLRRVNWIVTDWYRPEAYYKTSGWKATWNKDGGGVILNQCPHNLDLLQWICGMPSTVQGFCYEGKYHSIAVEDEATAYFEWKNGATGVFMSSTGEAAGINRLEINLENALLVCEDNQLKIYELDKPESEYKAEKTDFFTKPRTVLKNIPVPQAESPYETLLQKFSEGQNVAEGYEGINSLYISNAIYLSSWTGQKISIPESGTSAERKFEKAFEKNLKKHFK